MATPTKDALERAKLAAEIVKLEAGLEEARANTAYSVTTAEYYALQNRETLRRITDEEATDDRNHVYPFMGAVSGSSAEACIAKLMKWSRRDPSCDITIVFNSPGGSVIDGLALYDCIAELKAKGHRFTTVVRGYAASMGGILLQAGDRRAIGANAHVLIHELAAGTGGKLSEIKDSVTFYKLLEDRCIAILAERSTMSKAQIKRKCDRTDWWMDADETVRLGFADEIG